MDDDDEIMDVARIVPDENGVDMIGDDVRSGEETGVSSEEEGDG